MRTPLLPLLLVPALAPAPSAAQSPVAATLGEAPGDLLGAALAVCGDVDLDGTPDWAIGAPKADANGPSSGSVLVLSGRTGALLHRFDGEAPGVELGAAVAGAGDVDGDGHADVIAGAPRTNAAGLLSNGKAFVFSGADGTVLLELVGAHQFGFTGSAVAGAGDVDGDSKDDVLVGTPNADSSAVDAGLVELHSGATGASLRTHDGDTSHALFGAALAGGLDVDGDGVADYLVGAPGDDGTATDAGRARLHSGVDGSLLATAVGASAGDRLGASVALLGDLGANGRSEYGWGAPGAGGGDGAVFVRDDADAPLFSAVGSSGEALGAALANGGDLHGAGTDELLVGAPLAAGGGRVARFAPNGIALGDLPLPPFAGELGRALAGGVDGNGDGRDEALVGDPRDDEAASDAGRATLYSSAPLAGTPVCAGDAGPCPCGNQGAADEGCENSTGSGATLVPTGTASASVDALVLDVGGMPAGTPAVLFSATTFTGGTTGVPFRDGLLCASGGSQRMGVRFATSGGTARWGPGLAAEGGFRGGTSRVFQVWYRDPGGVCGTGSNTTIALRVDFTL